jgi:hypothetical protein
VVGSYIKKSKQLRYLVVFGNGSAWMSVVNAAILLATDDTAGADDIMTKLGVLRDCAASERTVDENDIRFQFVRFGDGQKLLKIMSLSEKPVKQRMVPVAVGIAHTTTQGNTVINYHTFGVGLTAFNNRFTKSVSAATARSATHELQHNSMQGALGFALGKNTRVMVFAADGKNASQIMITSSVEEAAEFWICTEAAIVALNPKIDEAGPKEILAELGKRRGNSLPKDTAHFDNGKQRFSYSLHDRRCILQIGRSHPDPLEHKTFE